MLAYHRNQLIQIILDKIKECEKYVEELFDEDMYNFVLEENNKVPTILNKFHSLLNI